VLVDLDSMVEGVPHGMPTTLWALAV